MKELDREVWELRRANEILRKASAYFAPAAEFEQQYYLAQEAPVMMPGVNQ